MRHCENEYKWLAELYRSIYLTNSANRLLWHRLGEKTLELIYKNIKNVDIKATGLETVAVDANTFETLASLDLFSEKELNQNNLTARGVLEKLEDKLQRKMQQTNVKPVWIKLSERLETLRQHSLETAETSIQFLKTLLEIAKDFIQAEKTEQSGTLRDGQILDPNKGALIQIFMEYAPSNTTLIIEHIVDQIDALVQPVKGTKWQAIQPGDREVRRQLRLLFKNNGLPLTGELFDKAYAYIKENY